MTTIQGATLNTPLTDKLFTGQRRYGPKSGLYHYGARFYSADIGRFLQADTIVPGGGEPAGAHPVG
jgi:RHS repeat-associated protein